MNGKLKKLINIYQPDGTDWMNFEYGKSNPYTYHHITKKENGGTSEVRNGAILTKKAHIYLHYLETADPDSYRRLNYMFNYLNSTMCPPTSEYYLIIEKILEVAQPYQEKNKELIRTRNRSKTN